MDIDKILERLKKLYDEGDIVLSTANYIYNRKSSKPIPQYVDNNKFTKWQSKCVTFLVDILSMRDYRTQKFIKNVNQNAYDDVNIGMAILKSLIEDINDGNFKLRSNKNNQRDKYSIIENIFNKFHRVSRQLKIRHNNRKTLEIDDEYDVQDLLHALLLIDFDDVRKEEWTPSYAGTSSRMDFLIKDINVVIETKMTRSNLKDKELGDQLIVDIERYSTHPNCDKLYCFVYDKEEFINNPIAVEEDLSSNNGDFEVKVFIVPKF
ncbi:hypothetical protein [uncultured Methanobrevibacter sp.]|uniref:PD-(D/E)XK nuclease domain-containing protein n=1 Tax=uncultured Methanobrevibacter sp. TaxID=253161 RepID=UPI0025FEA9C8|nr:hypothetical protein [uncultured Methanobrevibacter sp.]